MIFRPSFSSSYALSTTTFRHFCLFVGNKKSNQQSLTSHQHGGIAYLWRKIRLFPVFIIFDTPYYYYKNTRLFLRM